MNPKLIFGQSSEDIINKIKNYIPTYHQLTKEVEKSLSSSDPFRLITFNFYRGDVDYQRVIGGSIGLSESNKGRVCIITQDEEPYSPLYAYIYDPDNKFMRHMNPHWDEDWKKANFGAEFSWRNAKQKKVEIKEISHLYTNKVFIKCIGSEDENNYRKVFGNPSH